ncbi:MULTISPECIES: hypothetical protein [Liquorilactobacillus]
MHKRARNHKLLTTSKPFFEINPIIGNFFGFNYKCNAKYEPQGKRLN